MRKLNTEKIVCRMLAEALVAYGVRRVVTSPGSRNAPLLMALSRHGELETISVIDERCAAFEALGLADISGQPVALCCTSGSALLNYGPALAEAYYRHIPLIAVTADRPAEWIDQADSQTIRQPKALSNIVKCDVSLSDKDTSTDGLWLANRKLNDVLSVAISGPCGPVHINIHLSSPLTNEVETDGHVIFHKINVIAPPRVIPVETAREMAHALVGRQVLIVAGINPPDAKLNRAMVELSQINGFTVVDDGLANLRGGRITHFSNANFGEPEVLITFGGALISSSLKEYLRNCESIKEHWHINEADYAIDTFRKLTTRIKFPPQGYFPRLAGAIGHHTRIGDYKKKQAIAERQCICDNCSQNDWNSKMAIELLLNQIPGQWNLQLGNGMSVRYALPFVTGRFHRVTSNRGVSGIDGCVSTAIGASIVYERPTCLIVGDMSAQYDLGAFASNQITPKLKIVLLDNGGGEIFRRVATTRNLIEREPLIAGGVNLPVEELSNAFGFRYLAASDQRSFEKAARAFVNEKERPSMLHIIIENQ